MGNYLLKRLLLMIPTLVGISLVVFVIMVAAPGRPGDKAQSFGEQNPSSDPTKDKSQGESQRLFRRQFALDRPVFWNHYPWIGTDAKRLDDVRRTLWTASGPVEASSIKEKREAKERLEDWGYFAVPSLVEILKDPALSPQQQSDTLFWLRSSATRLAVQPYGRTLDAETLRQNDEWLAENFVLAKWGWKNDDPPVRRAEVIGLWSAWYEKHRDRWPTDTGPRLATAIFDTQFATYWKNLIHLDFGISHVHKRPVLSLIGERLPITVLLSGLATLIAYLLAVPLGILSAVRPYTRTDRVMTVSLFLLYSLPSFFVGTVLLTAFTIGQPYKWFPNSGWRAEGAFGLNSWAQVRDVIWHITMPLVVSTYGGLAALSRYARTGMLDVVRSDYVRTARAKGLSEGTVILRHAARNGMMPIVTLLGGLLPSLIGGSIFVEFVFNIQGMGLLTIEAITSRDYNIIMAESLIVAVLTLVGILISDLLYAVMDPRISYK